MQVHVVAPRADGVFFLCDIGGDNRSGCFGNDTLLFIVFPQFANFLERFDGVLVEESVAVGSHIENEGAASLVHRAEVVVDHLFGRFSGVCRHIRFPEPAALQWIACH